MPTKEPQETLSQRQRARLEREQAEKKRKQKRLIIVISIAAALIIGLTLAIVLPIVLRENTTVPPKKDPAGDPTNPIVTIVVENYGTIVLELYPQYAPNTVNSFIKSVEEGFYDGLGFHRVGEGFVIQGGDPAGTGAGSPGWTIKGEFPNNGFTRNNLLHTEGVISMARSSANDSAGSQFFIMDADYPGLNGGYAPFGRVISGMEVVHAIAKAPGTALDESTRNPTNHPIMTSVIVDTKGIDYPDPVRIAR
jgi:peptidyl-prolyl cis-trans isomerase B (cyclophilin B)